MKATGVVRKMDLLGRIVIPKEVRDSFGMEEGTPMEIFADEKGVYIRKYKPGCMVCGNVENLETIYVRGSHMRFCPHCLTDIVKYLMMKDSSAEQAEACECFELIES